MKPAPILYDRYLAFRQFGLPPAVARRCAQLSLVEYRSAHAFARALLALERRGAVRDRQ